MACETAACNQHRAPVASLGYTPRQAECTVLHQVVRENLETFLATTARADPSGLPTFLEQEFRGFLVLTAPVVQPTAIARVGSIADCRITGNGMICH